MRGNLARLQAVELRAKKVQQQQTAGQLTLTSQLTPEQLRAKQREELAAGVDARVAAEKLK